MFTAGERRADRGHDGSLSVKADTLAQAIFLPTRRGTPKAPASGGEQKNKGAAKKGRQIFMVVNSYCGVRGVLRQGKTPDKFKRAGREPRQVLAAPTPLRPACAITLPAVEQAVKQADLPLGPGRAEGQVHPSQSSSCQLPGEDASRYCPVCSQRLESRRCKLICNLCGYYMSCADYV